MQSACGLSQQPVILWVAWLILKKQDSCIALDGAVHESLLFFWELSGKNRTKQEGYE
ncbi:hypothetical protein CLOSTMETH_03746 [[Clostridium] methylpentosum DSM 5476]|uniref:Uncharacterized protein n=1 Tax=[Clostridium] methylpentosum DSM 5476 TaxID=537013 RepID=C0EIQ1_9FIRM|nr:hypothetical protein CLOSTMETH_03746 [[Clostridium] methylpentosum DSM 5476]